MEGVQQSTKFVDSMTNGDWLTVANKPMMWVMVVPCLVMVLVQAWIFIRKSISAGHLVGLEKSEIKTALRVGAICSIGPGISMFTVMLPMMKLLGAPFAWLRMSIIGTVVTETLGAQAAAKAMGTELGGASFGIISFACAVWVITLNTFGFFSFNFLFAHKFEDVRKAISKYDIHLFNYVGTCIMMGAIGMFTAGEMTKDFLKAEKNSIEGASKIIAVLMSGFTMFMLLQISKKYPKLSEYSLGIAMLIGMFSAQFFKTIFLVS